MATENDAGLNKGEFVHLKKLEESLNWFTGFFQVVMHRITAGNSQTQFCSHVAPGAFW